MSTIWCKQIEVLNLTRLDLCLRFFDLRKTRIVQLTFKSSKIDRTAGYASVFFGERTIAVRKKKRENKKGIFTNVEKGKQLGTLDLVA